MSPRSRAAARMFAAAVALVVGARVASWPAPAHAFESDEHKHLWEVAMAPMPAELRALLRDPVNLQVFTSTSTGAQSVMPAPFASANRVAARGFGISEMAQLPDLSYALWDWASGNETCPPAAGLSAKDCHDYKTRLGPLNSTHFLPQARFAFQHLHSIALTKAAHCGTTRRRLAGAPARLAAYADDCILEAFALEAVAHHFLQDAFSTGHMWARWGSPNASDFPGGFLAQSNHVAIAVAAMTGLLHGGRAMLKEWIPAVDWNDPLCGPFDVRQFPVDGVSDEVMFSQGMGSSLYRGVGDYYVPLMETAYRQQYDQILDCERAAIQEVAIAAGLPVPDASTLPGTNTSSQVFIDRCFGNHVTNQSLLLGFGVDGIREGNHVHVALDDVGGLLQVVPAPGGAVGQILSTDVRVLGHDLSVIGNVIRTEAGPYPFDTDLATDGLPPLAGVESNNVYVSTPPAPYSDPTLPFTLTFGGPTGAVQPANMIARAFHRAHALDWCEITTVADLESLRGGSGLDAQATAARCQVCMEIAGRHVRVGKSDSDYDRSKEPLCAYLVGNAAAYVYDNPDSGDSLEAIQHWCDCGGQDSDGGMDGPADAPTADGAGGAGGGVISGDGGVGGSSGGDTGSGNSSGGGNSTGGGNTSGGNTTGAGNSSGGGNTTGGGGTVGSAGMTGSAGTSGGGNTTGAAGTMGNWDDWDRPAPDWYRCREGWCAPINDVPPPPPWLPPPSSSDPRDPPADDEGAWKRFWDWANDLIGGLLGDPHLTTMDGLMFDFQAVGEFVLVDDGADVRVQVRQGRWHGSSDAIAGITAIAARVGGHRVGFYPGEVTPVRVDGVPVDLTAELALPGGGSIHPLPGAYVVTWPDGAQMHVRVIDPHLDVMVRVPFATAANRHLVGLLGNGDRDPTNDVALRDGTVLPLPVSRADRYGVYADAWRVREAESLFDYPPGLGTADFTDRTLPTKATSAALLSATEHAEAIAACRSLGVVLPALLNACALDYAVGKDPRVIRAYQGMPAPLVVNPSADYAYDFEAAEPDRAWSHDATAVVPASARLGPNRYAGPFTDQSVTVFMENLPAHRYATVSFDLYVMGDWNGGNWMISASNRQILMSATFDNVGGQQSYPQFVGVGLHPSRAGASMVDALSAAGSAIPDAVYHQRYTFDHTGTTLLLRFDGPSVDVTSNVRWGLDNVEVILDAPAGTSTTTVGSTTILHGASGPPAVVGCADGRREAFLDTALYPDIAGCLATWNGTVDLRAAPVGVACGDGLVACTTAADACAPGWHPCGAAGDVAELRSAASGEQCAYAGSGAFVAAMSHCNGSTSGVCDYVDQPGETAGCAASGWCSEAVCCGSDCHGGICKDGVWPSQTSIFSGCRSVPASAVGGVLCCR
jgi:hypothetical protein